MASFSPLPSGLSAGLFLMLPYQRWKEQVVLPLWVSAIHVTTLQAGPHTAAALCTQGQPVSQKTCLKLSRSSMRPLSVVREKAWGSWLQSCVVGSEARCMRNKGTGVSYYHSLVNWEVKEILPRDRDGVQSSLLTVFLMLSVAYWNVLCVRRS